MSDHIDWQQASSWMHLFSFEKKFQTDIQNLCANIDEVPFPDNNDWFEIWEKASDIDFEERIGIVSEILRTEKLVVYHACRTDNPDNYLKFGIIPHHPGKLLEIFSQMSNQVPSLAEQKERIELNILDQSKSQDDERGLQVFASMDPRWLLEHAPHYLVYGSETIWCAIPHHLREDIKGFGSPTFIRASYSLSDCRPAMREEIAQNLFREWIRLTAVREDTPRLLQYAIVTERGQGFPPDNILGINFPAITHQILDRARQSY